MQNPTIEVNKGNRDYTTFEWDKAAAAEYPLGLTIGKTLATCWINRSDSEKIMYLIAKGLGYEIDKNNKTVKEY